MCFQILSNVLRALEKVSAGKKYPHFIMVPYSYGLGLYEVSLWLRLFVVFNGLDLYDIYPYGMDHYWFSLWFRRPWEVNSIFNWRMDRPCRYSNFFPCINSYNDWGTPRQIEGKRGLQKNWIVNAELSKMKSLSGNVQIRMRREVWVEMSK